MMCFLDSWVARIWPVHQIRLYGEPSFCQHGSISSSGIHPHKCYDVFGVDGMTYSPFVIVQNVVSVNR